MPEGGKLTLETSSTTRRAGGRSVQFVQIAITDTGVGMSAEVMEQVFEPFFTTKDSGKGTGLGLATCYGIVTQADGSIEVASKQGVGTRFDVLLPTAAAGAEEKAGPEGGADIPQGLETILVVDDEPLVRNLATRILRKAGYYVSAASGPDEALAAAAGQQVDLLLTDIVMPRTNGRALAKAFVSQSPGTRVLYMSGYADDTALREEIASGEAAFLQKPFVAGDLATKVREVLDAT
jgi:CheY-like chemotaxis protein